MSKGIKILIAVIVAILVLISAFVIAISNTKMPQIEPCDLSALSELELPDSRIIAIGTPTHGNAEPITNA